MIVQDPTLIEVVDVAGGLKEDGIIIINSDFDPSNFKLDTRAKVVTVNATKIALEVIGRPIVNTVLLGAFAGATGEIRPESIKEAVKERFPGKVGDRNAEAIQQAYDMMKEAKV